MKSNIRIKDTRERKTLEINPEKLEQLIENDDENYKIYRSTINILFEMTNKQYIKWKKYIEGGDIKWK